MDICPNNMSMASTRNKNVSKKLIFRDTFFGCVHAVDMNEQDQTVTDQYVAIADNMKELGYDR